MTGENEFIDFSLDNHPILFSGDWYVGFQHAKPGNGAFVAADSGGPPRKASFYSEDGGVTFRGPALNATVPLNFMIRAVVDSVERPRRRP